MAFITDISAPHRNTDGFWAGFAQRFEAYASRRSRRTQIEALEAKSDADLARMGIPRDRIVQYVFRDMIAL